MPLFIVSILPPTHELEYVINIERCVKYVTLGKPSNTFPKNVVYKEPVFYLIATVYVQHKQSISVELCNLIHRLFTFIECYSTSLL